jgi:hypothetical protein
MLKKILYLLLAAAIIIQFFHPKRNKAEGAQPNYIGTAYSVPEDVKSILVKACNDCHSNNTRYPWYCYVQPVDWWTHDHVVEGKTHLNFDEFADKSPRYQYNKLGECKEQLEKGEMPLNSYLWIHKDAKLTEAEKNTLIAWTTSIREEMKTKYPMDSLIRKKRSQ